MPDAGGPGDFHDPHRAPVPVAGYEDYGVGGVRAFSGDDAQDGDGGDPGGDVCPLPDAGPCQDLSAIRYVTGDHGVLDVVHVLVPYFYYTSFLPDKRLHPDTYLPAVLVKKEAGILIFSGSYLRTMIKNLLC